MCAVRVISGILGLILLVSTIASILRNLIVPRGLDSILVRSLSRATRATLHGVARLLRTYLMRDKLLAWLAPIVLLATLLWWLTILFLAYGLLLYSISKLSFPVSLREAGSSLFTLGFSSAARGTCR